MLPQQRLLWALLPPAPPPPCIPVRLQVGGWQSSVPLIASLLHTFKTIEKNGAHTDQNIPQRRGDMGVERDFLDSQEPLKTVLGGEWGRQL